MSAFRSDRSGVGLRGDRMAVLVGSMLFAVVSLVACAPSSTRVRSATPIGGPSVRAEIAAADSVVPLAADEGFLVVHVDTNAPLERLSAGNVAIVDGLGKGRYVWLVRMKAGRYAWTEIAFAAEPISGNAQRVCRRDRVARVNPLSDLSGVERSEFEFDVEPGALNYAGELILNAEYHYLCRGAYRLWIRNRNHSAMALNSLMETHPAYLDALSIRYAGRSGDGFLEFYTRERKRLGAEALPSEVP
jgi:hypothetical protein